MIPRAATVMIVRDGPDGLEIFMVRRASKSTFMPDAYVYPGGRFDEDDRHDIFENASESDALVVTAIRETFEESGYLLQSGVSRDVDRAAWRHLLNDGGHTFSKIVSENRLLLEREEMHFVAHWITPQSESKRFDTYFYLTRPPDNQDPSHDDCETTDAIWVRPTDALTQHKRGELLLFPPTFRTLEIVSEMESTDAAMAWGNAIQPVAILPYFLPDAETPTIVMSGDPKYPSDPPFDAYEPLPIGEQRITFKDGAWLTT